MIDLLIDLETLDTNPTAVVTEMVWARFNPSKTKESIEGEVFTGFPCPWNQIAAGRTIDPSTITWHLNGGTLKRDGADHLPNLLHSLREDANDVRYVWTWGSDFDAPILKSLFQQAGMELPWKYYQVKDARTAWDLAFPGERPEKRSHHAEDDVKASIRDLVTSIYELTNED